MGGGTQEWEHSVLWTHCVPWITIPIPQTVFLKHGSNSFASTSHPSPYAALRALPTPFHS